MCAICGMIKMEGVSECDRELVIQMRDMMIHRGPDDAGLYSDLNIALGHRRLSILDLSPAGHQPMEYLDRYVIAFNGEIYNYIELRRELSEKGYFFQTKTDTEVIMAAYDMYGYSCFERFNGMWALALWDKREKKLVLSRDRFGVKPLYYHLDGEKLIFASEIKALLEDETIERRANSNIVYDYLTQGLMDHTDETFFEDIYRFPQASYAIVDKKLSLEFHEYWSMDFCEETGNGLTNESVCKFRNLFGQSVKLRLRSDVPVGSCLSGGLDSSAIVCCIDDIRKKEQREDTAQFTFSYRADDKKIDEFEYMQAVIDETDVKAEFVTPKASELFEDLDSLIYHQDEPFTTTGMYAGYRVYKKARECNVKVLLDGQGADELLCGYRKSRLYYIGMLKKERKYGRLLKELILSISQFQSSKSIRSMMKSDFNKILRIIRKDKKRSNISEQYYNKEFLNSVNGYDYDRRDNFQYNDVYKISLPALLRFTDRNSMAFSVESRLPFLDYEFAEYCASLPISQKLTNGYSKAIMRTALKMPEKIRRRKDKIGFATPEDIWLQKEASKIRKIMEYKGFRAGRFVNQEKILDNWDAIINHNAIPYFFRVVCLERWMQIFEVN